MSYTQTTYKAYITLRLAKAKNYKKDACILQLLYTLNIFLNNATFLVYYKKHTIYIYIIIFMLKLTLF